MRIGRIPYVNCYPVYGAIDRGIVPVAGELIDGVPSHLNRLMASDALDLSVVSAVEYARDPSRYLLLPDLAISCDGPVRSVLLFSTVPAEELEGRRVLVSRSSMTSVALLELLCEAVWKVRPVLEPADVESPAAAEPEDAHHRRGAGKTAAARLVIGDAALRFGFGSPVHDDAAAGAPFVYDLGAEWKRWTGLPFVFAVWVARRGLPVAESLAAHASLIQSRDWGLRHIETLAVQAHETTGVSLETCRRYLSDLDYGLSYGHLAGLTEFFRRLAAAGRVPNGTLAFLPAA